MSQSKGEDQGYESSVESISGCLAPIIVAVAFFVVCGGILWFILTYISPAANASIRNNTCTTPLKEPVVGVVTDKQDKSYESSLGSQSLIEDYVVYVRIGDYIHQVKVEDKSLWNEIQKHDILQLGGGYGNNPAYGGRCYSITRRAQLKFLNELPARIHPTMSIYENPNFAVPTGTIEAIEGS